MLRFNHYPIAVLCLVTICLTARTRADEQAGAKPPAVPPLIVGAAPPAPQSFVATGFVRYSAEKGLGFHVATDGKRERCVLYDAADGTPLFISDGRQTLIYDLAENRILRVPTCRGNVRVDWDPKAPKPLSFNFKFDFKTDPKKLEESNAWIRLDRFVEASAAELKRVETPAGAGVWAAERRGGAIESVQADPADPSWFSFRSLANGKDFYALEVHATGIGRPTAAESVAFPDVEKFGRDVPVEPFDLKAKPALFDTFTSGRCFTPKLALAGEDPATAIKRIFPKVDVDALREQDARFSAHYRAALAAQGVTFPTLKSANATTRPAPNATTQTAR
jgi:hypothetical protein